MLAWAWRGEARRFLTVNIGGTFLASLERPGPPSGVKIFEELARNSTLSENLCSYLS
jgi:hypothetical protein